MDDEMRYPAGEPTRLIAAYRRAVGAAAQLRARLIASGLDPRDLTVSAGVNASGQPVVHVTVLPVVAVHLSALIAEDSGEPPSKRETAGPHGDPDAA